MNPSVEERERSVRVRLNYSKVLDLWLQGGKSVSMQR